MYGFRPDCFERAIKTDGRPLTAITTAINDAYEVAFGELPDEQQHFSLSHLYRIRTYKSIAIVSIEEMALIFGALQQTEVAFDDVWLPERLVYGAVARQHGVRHTKVLRHLFSLAIDGQLPAADDFQRWIISEDCPPAVSELLIDPAVLRWTVGAAAELGFACRSSAAAAALKLYNQTISERLADEEADLLAVGRKSRIERKPACRRLHEILEEMRLARWRLDLRRFVMLDAKAHGTVAAILGEEARQALDRVFHDFIGSPAHRQTMDDWEHQRSPDVEACGVAYMERALALFQEYEDQLGRTDCDGITMGNLLGPHLEDYRKFLKSMA